MGMEKLFFFLIRSPVPTLLNKSVWYARNTNNEKL